MVNYNPNNGHFKKSAPYSGFFMSLEEKPIYNENINFERRNSNEVQST